VDRVAGARTGLLKINLSRRAPSPIFRLISTPLAATLN